MKLTFPTTALVAVVLCGAASPAHAQFPFGPFWPTQRPMNQGFYSAGRCSTGRCPTPGNSRFIGSSYTIGPSRTCPTGACPTSYGASSASAAGCQTICGPNGCQTVCPTSGVLPADYTSNYAPYGSYLPSHGGSSKCGPNGCTSGQCGPNGCGLGNCGPNGCSPGQCGPNGCPTNRFGGGNFRSPSTLGGPVGSQGIPSLNLDVRPVSGVLQRPQGQFPAGFVPNDDQFNGYVPNRLPSNWNDRGLRGGYDSGNGDSSTAPTWTNPGFGGPSQGVPFGRTRGYYPSNAEAQQFDDPSLTFN